LEGEFQFSDGTTWGIPFLPTLEGPEATILYGILLVLIIFFMPGGIIYGLRVLRSKLLLIIPRLPTPTTTHRLAEPEAVSVPKIADQGAVESPI
jgi:hypothetical protein